MGAVVMRCPATGKVIPTGLISEREAFERSPVFFADTYCPLCEASHRWFARDAWVEEPRPRFEARAA